MSQEFPSGESAGPAWRAIVIAALVAAVLFSSFLTLPFFGGFLLPFAPSPAVRVAHRRGLGAGVWVAAGAAMLLFLATVASTDPRAAAFGSLVAFVLIALPAVAAAWTRRGASATAAYLALSAGGALLLGGLLLASSAPGRRSPGQEIAAMIDGMAPSAVARAQLDPETAARAAAFVKSFRDFASAYWVGLAAACWVLGSALAFYTGSRFARPAPSAQAVRFEALRVPTFAVALFAVSGAGAVLAEGAWKRASADLLIPLVALYFVLGLSIICHFARRWFRVRLLRVGLYALVVYFPMNVVVALLGLFDWYADFRRRGEGALEKS